jgi:hypothetical protein
MSVSHPTHSLCNIGCRASIDKQQKVHDLTGFSPKRGLAMPDTFFPEFIVTNVNFVEGLAEGYIDIGELILLPLEK